jgi:hypothetical protein
LGFPIKTCPCIQVDNFLSSGILWHVLIGFGSGEEFFMKNRGVIQKLDFGRGGKGGGRFYTVF